MAASQFSWFTFSNRVFTFPRRFFTKCPGYLFSHCAFLLILLVATVKDEPLFFSEAYFSNVEVFLNTRRSFTTPLSNAQDCTIPFGNCVGTSFMECTATSIR